MTVLSVSSLNMLDWTANIFSFLQTNVEIKRELRYCDGFKCKSIYFIPQVCKYVSCIMYDIVNLDAREGASPVGPYALCRDAACTGPWTPGVSSLETTSPGSTPTTGQPS